MAEERTRAAGRLQAALTRVRRSLIRARVLQRIRHPDRPRLPRIMSALVFLIAGWMIATSALAAHGLDLRPERNTDLISLVNSEAKHNADLVAKMTVLRGEVDALTAQRNKLPNVDAELAQAREEAGLTSVHGPALTVTLTDAPLDINPAGIDSDLLVVYQQDIQAVANALWAAGAEAMTIQGVRVVATTAIKCVGNTVVLHGIPYAPPYVITAIGGIAELQAGLDASDYVTNYRAYAERFQLGYAVASHASATLPGFTGSVELHYARRLGSSGGTGQPR